LPYADEIENSTTCRLLGVHQKRLSKHGGDAPKLTSSGVVAIATIKPVPLRNVEGRGRGSMRPSFCIFGLAVVWLITSSAQAHSRGFAWFFSHSRPHGTCSGQHVVATYYTSGRRTASGQAFDPSGYTAAHRSLPFGSRVTVTNPENGKSVTVVINDRGPFTRGVTLDLTRGAARAIGMYGTQWVCLL
jgi:rare lipoprotein A